MSDETTEPDPSLREQFEADAASVDALFGAFWTPGIAASIRRCVEGEYDPPDAEWRQP